MLILLLLGLFTLGFGIRFVFAQEIVSINPDGSITAWPSPAPITTLDNVTYTFTGNMSYPAYIGIIVSRNNIVIDGNGYTVQGYYAGLVGEGPIGVSLTALSNVTIENANILTFYDGISLVGCSNCKVSGNNISDNSYGIYFDYANNNTITGNNITGNSGYGIELEGSSTNSISRNNMNNNDAIGIVAFSSNNNSISGNNITNNGEGIYLDYFSNDNTVSGNNATANSDDGIGLYSSSGNIVSGNNATANSFNGIFLVYSSSNSVIGNIVTANDPNNVVLNSGGINFQYSSNNTVNENNATANQYGIYLSYYSNNNTVIGNDVTANSFDGIFLDSSSNNNTAIGNNITANSYGIYLFSSNNTIYHNNFIGNVVQAFVCSASVGNVWDDGYPSGGNYWSDYKGTDLFSGPYQNVTGSDGIGDSPYVIDANNRDLYPLMELYAGPISIVDWWSMFQHDATHTGYSTSTVPMTNQTLWAFKTGGPVDSSPAVVDGVVYIGSNDNNVYALNATTGTLIWSYTTGGIVRSSPAVVGGMVYVGSEDNNVYAFNATTGVLIWSYTTGSPVVSSPTVVRGVVYVGSYDDDVYALNATTGLQVWNYTTGGHVDSSPAVAGGVVYVGDRDGNVYALNAATGAYVWSFATGGPVPSSPAVVDGVVYIGSDDWNVYALDAATGAYMWSVRVGGSVPCSPAVSGGVVYVGSEDNNVYAFNATTGAYMWSYATGNGVGFSSPAVAGGMVFVGSDDDNVYGLNATIGTLVWSYTTNGHVESSPAVSTFGLLETPSVGAVFAGSEDGNVYAFASVQLTVTSSYGSPNLNGTSSNAPGTSVTASVTSPVAGPVGTQYVCTGWTGTGDAPASGTGTSVTFTITQDSTITWNWKTQYEVTFGQSGLAGTSEGTVAIVDSSTETYGELPFSMWVDNGTSMSYSYEIIVSSSSAGEQFALNDVNGPTSPTTVTSPLTVTGNYVTQYNVTFSQIGVGPDFHGTVVIIDGVNYTAGSGLPTSFWWDSGSTHSFAFQSSLAVGPSIKPYVWSSTTGFSMLQSASINVTGPGSITGNYATDIHDVTVTSITTNNTWFYQGQTASINVTVSNIGDFPENVWITLYSNITTGTSINAYPVSLDLGQSYTLQFIWNTASVRCLNYTLTAVATIPTGSNTLSGVTITARLLGDVNGDGRVDMKDIAMVARSFGSTPASPNWNPAADLNGDGTVNMKDIAIVARNFGQHC